MLRSFRRKCIAVLGGGPSQDDVLARVRGTPCVGGIDMRGQPEYFALAAPDGGRDLIAQGSERVERSKGHGRGAIIACPEWRPPAPGEAMATPGQWPELLEDAASRSPERGDPPGQVFPIDALGQMGPRDAEGSRDLLPREVHRLQHMAWCVTLRGARRPV